MQFISKYKELLLGATMIALAVFYLYETSLIEIRIRTAFNSKYIPTMLGVLVLFLGVAQCALAYSSLRGGVGAEEKRRVDFRTVLLLCGTIFAYVFALEPVGFLISTIIMMFCQMMLLCPTNQKKRPVLFALVSVISSIFIYYLFRDVLELMLPEGILG
jgi:putative tricarboxylic transport membrane protein